MSEEKQNRAMSAFESALAALRPRSNLLPSPFGKGAGGEGMPVASDADQTALTLALSQRERKKGQPCSNPGGHQFVCLYCGADAPGSRAGHRWVWPASFAVVGSTAVLLVILVTSWKTPTADHGADTAAAGSRVATQPQNDFARTEQLSPLPQRLFAGGSDATCYLNLRDQVLRYGVESWKSPVAAMASLQGKAERPLSYREQLESLLQQQDMRGS